MKNILLWAFLCLFVCHHLQAQTNTDSIPTNEVDSIVELVPPTPPLPTYDTLGVTNFGLAFKEDKLIITANSIVGRTNVPVRFVAKMGVGEEVEHLYFEDTEASVDYAPTYTGELLTVKAFYKTCKVKGCADCDTKTHPNPNEIICLEQKRSKIMHVMKQTNGHLRTRSIPLWWSIVPPLVAILLALIFRQVLLALFMGILAGSWVVNGMQFSPYGLMKSFFYVIDHYIIGALYSTSHLSVITFSVMIGGVVAIISRNGGMAGIVNKFAPLAKDAKSTQMVTWILGVAIFFDDYANSLIVGNTMRPLTDKYRISREKLAYIVDSTAAPIAAVAFITTWIGAELNYISDAIPSLTGLENPPSAYSIFLSSLSYSFYSFFTLIFILIIIYTGRDFGTMYKAETRARITGRVYEKEGDSVTDDDMEELEPVKGAPLRWINGFLPIFIVVFGTLMGLIDTGMEACYAALVEDGVAIAHSGWGEVWGHIQALDSSGDAGALRKLGILVGNSDSYAALLWASMSAIVVALILTVSQKIMPLSESIETVVAGFKTMMPALLILILAWSLATTTEELSTAEFLTTALGDSLSPYMVPVIVFILAAVIAFSTGSSWSTMAILYPIAIPMVWIISQNAGLPLDISMELLYNVIAVVLAASVLGDHCSPISDTTILSSLACNCNHIDHVKTQLPYALTVGTVSILMTYLSTAFGIPFIINFVVGVGLLFGFVMLVGKKLPEEEEAIG